jgi:hypothetical protein
MSSLLARTASRSADPIPAFAWRASLAALCLILLAPLLLVEVPPLLDYPNHLARLFVLALGGNDPVVAAFYTVRWSIIPDLGIDLIGPPLIHVLPIHVAGRVLIGLVLLLPVLGSLAYSHALLGRRSWWSLGCGLVAYHQTFMLGFLNFTAAMGLAMWLVALWLRGRETHPWRTVALTALGCVGLYLCHLMGVVFLGILIAAYELTWLLQSPRTRLLAPSVVVARLVAAAGVFGVPLALYAGSALSKEAGGPVYLTAQGKLEQLLAPWTNYLLPLDIATSVATIAAIFFLLVRRQLQVPLQAAIVLLLLGVLYLICPFAYAGVINIDMRFVVLAGFVLFAGLAPLRVPAWLSLGLVALFLTRIGVVAVAWHGHTETIATLRGVIASVPTGSTVFVSTMRPENRFGIADARRLSNGVSTTNHLPALLLIERRAWWPFMFDNDSQQPIATRSPYLELALQADRMPEDRRQIPVSACDLVGFDYVLMLGRLTDAPLFLTPVAAAARVSLYRVAHADCPPPR